MLVTDIRSTVNQSTFSDIADALKLDFSVEVNGNKYSLQLKKKRKSYIILPDSFGNDSHNFHFFFIRLIMEEKAAEELHTFSTS